MKREYFRAYVRIISRMNHPDWGWQRLRFEKEEIVVETRGNTQQEFTPHAQLSWQDTHATGPGPHWDGFLRQHWGTDAIDRFENFTGVTPRMKISDL